MATTYRVIKDHASSYPDPITVQAGEIFKVSKKTDRWNDDPRCVWVWCTDQREKSGWMPKNIIQPVDEGSKGTTRTPYSAVELTVSVGDELIGEREEAGWVWARDNKGQLGWVPSDHIEKME